jgi:hypothetical protein
MRGRGREMRMCASCANWRAEAASKGAWIWAFSTAVHALGLLSGGAPSLARRVRYLNTRGNPGRLGVEVQVFGLTSEHAESMLNADLEMDRFTRVVWNPRTR